MKNLLSINQLTLNDVLELTELAWKLEPVARRQKITNVLQGAVLANLFFEPSTRTRVSFEAAFCRLGGAVSSTTGVTFSSMAKGESLEDTSRVISGYADVIVVRHPEEGSVAMFANMTNIPVINGGDGPGEHPTQALLDIYTIKKEFKRLNKEINGAHIAFFGDLKYGRTVHSLVKLLSMFEGLRFTFVAPEPLSLAPEYIELLKSRGHTVNLLTDPHQLSDKDGIDVLYATRIQKERFAKDNLSGVKISYQINAELIKQIATPDTIIMHPLPRDGSAGANDLSTDLDGDSRLAIFRQTDSGIPMRMAIFAKLLGVDKDIEKTFRDPAWKSPQKISPIDADFYHLHD